jgi:biotin carboxyl carrier protein
MVSTMTGRSEAFRADGWRLAGPPAPVVVQLDRPVTVDRAAGRVDDVRVQQLSAERHVMVLSIEGRREQAVVNAQPDGIEVVHQGHRWVFVPPEVLAHAADAAEGSLAAPMPGTVLAVEVAVGDAVSAGQTLGVMEAMKMELALKAPYDGTVTSVAAVGDQVALGHVLFTVDPLEDS